MTKKVKTEQAGCREEMRKTFSQDERHTEGRKKCELASQRGGQQLKLKSQLEFLFIKVSNEG